MTEASGVSPFVWSPQDGPQLEAIMASSIEEIFFGGQAGGGKTDFLLGDYAQDLWQNDWVGILFRRHSTDMSEIIRRSMQIYPHIGGEFKVGTKTWKFPNGCELLLRHMDTDADFPKYLGASYSWIGFDELPTYDTMRPYNMMKTRLRGKAKYKRIRSTGNPGGRSHAEVKEYFCIREYPNGGVPLRDKKSNMVRMFLPSKISDNKKLLETDPDYPRRLMSLGDPELTRAYLEGAWDVAMGAFFQCSRDRIFCDPFDVPSNWPLFVAMDYGENNPSAGVLVAVDNDDDVWCVDSYYSSGSGAQHADGIKHMIESCAWTRGGGAFGRNPRMILSPADMWTKRSPGEVSLARSPADTFRERGMHLTRANMDRVNGWRNIANLLYNGRLRFFRGTTDRIVDSLLSLQREVRNPEDASSGDDHGADALRYAINHCYKSRYVDERKENDGGRLIDQLSDDQLETRYL